MSVVPQPTVQTRRTVVAQDKKTRHSSMVEILRNARN